MKIAVALLFVIATPTWANPPGRVVATGLSEWSTQVVLTIESCNPQTGSMRSYQSRPISGLWGPTRIEYGCWGYNEQGVQFQWEDGRTMTMPYTGLWNPQDNAERPACDPDEMLACPIFSNTSQMSYNRMYQRVYQLTRENRR